MRGFYEFYDLLSCCNLHVALFLLTVVGDGSLRVDWSAASSLSDLALLGSTRTCLARRLILTAPLGALDFSEVPLTISFFFFFFFSMIYPVCFPSYHKHPLPERLAHIWFTVDSDHTVEGDDALPSAEACREQAHSCRGDGFALNWMCGKRFYGLTSLPRTQHSIDTCI